MRENIEKIPPLYFSSCENCSECCEGKFFLAPLVLEDFDKVRDYFEIRAVVLNNEIIPVILLTDGEGGSCPYLENGKCSIYNRRPPACKIYPFSPFYDDIFIDISCKGVSSNGGKKLPSNREEFVKSSFFDSRFENFKYKRDQTLKYMKTKKLTFDKKINGIKIYKF